MIEMTLKLEEEKLDSLMKIYHTKNQNEAVEKAIEEAYKKSLFQSLLNLKGKVKWEGKLEDMRSQVKPIYMPLIFTGNAEKKDRPYGKP
jgi:hypothetical protein